MQRTADRTRPRAPLAVLALCAFGLMSTAAPPASAHDVVLVPSGTELVVRYGHPKDWLHVDADKLIELTVTGADGASRDRRAELRRRGLDLVLRGAPGPAPTLVAARYDNGVWVKLAPQPGRPDAYRNAGRLMVPDAAEAFASVKFAKALVSDARDDRVWRAELGHLLEIVPQRNPATVPVGESLPVLVRFNGKPLANAGVEDGDLVTQPAEDRVERFKTDANGIAQVPMRRRGLHRLAVDVSDEGSLGDAAKALGVSRVMLVATFAFRN